MVGVGAGARVGRSQGAPAAVLCGGGGEHSAGQPREQLLVALAQGLGPTALDARGGGAELFRVR